MNQIAGSSDFVWSLQYKRQTEYSDLLTVVVGEHLETCLMLPEQHPKLTVKVLDKCFARSFEQKFYGFSGP